MAKPKSETIGSVLTTTIIFPPKSTVEELMKLKRDTKKRTQSQNGQLGDSIKSAIEDKHLDRKAFSIACQLEALDDERLHVTYHSLIRYCEMCGVTKRAMAQEDLFDGGAGGEPEAKVKDKEPDDGKVTPIGRAARKVAESAGSDNGGFTPTH